MEQFFVEYNSHRSKLHIPEYGRNLQKMVKHCCTIEDNEERNKCAKAIIHIMGQMNPHLRDVADFNHKLWAHLFIMSDFKLDVDSPYPKPDPEKKAEAPPKLSYPNKDIRYRHYGRTVQMLIEKAKEMEDGDEKNAFMEVIANFMKKSYLNWNRDSVNDQMIFDHLIELSNGELKLRDDFVLNQTSDILAMTKRKRKPQHNQKNNNIRHRRKHNN
ncbi:MAG: methionyl-tRNA formyltransferase [Flavobacteriales bacterium]|nr:MAG: methionyl-tRNA formyltransferase [Flavobacteriales bacterium]